MTKNNPSDTELINEFKSGYINMEVRPDVDISLLPLHQGLEIKRGLRTKPVIGHLNRGTWIRIYKASVKGSNEDIHNILEPFGVVEGEIQYIRYPKRNMSNANLNALGGVRNGDRPAKVQNRKFLPTCGWL